MARADRVSDAAPTSYSGSLTRIWGSVGWPAVRGAHPVVRWTVGPLLAVLAIGLIGLAWLFVTGWYALFGLLVIPWRMFRKSGRRNKKLRAELDRRG